jgi:MerR family transcriptional regulator, light-induced transcriptional regulator
MSAHPTPPTPRADPPRIRIGELSRRTGVRAETLRAWERRYGLLRPSRSDGGFRLYGPADEGRVRAMTTLIARGVSPAEAARLALAEGADALEAGQPSAGHVERLVRAFERFDEADANAILDDALARYTVVTFVSDVVLPALRGIGDGWQRGRVSVAQEHFATALLRGRMLGIGRNWGVGAGPRALLACPSDERHDLGLIAFGLLLRERGWRITFLGGETPMETIAQASAELDPAAIVIAAVASEPLQAAAEQIRALAAVAPLSLGGAGADQRLADELGAGLLDQDPVEAAAQLSA